jgi:hypothetical protein
MAIRKKNGIKKTIAKKIEFRHKQLRFINNGEQKKMDELDRLRIYGNGNKPVDARLLTRDEMRYGIKIKDENNIANIGDIFRIPYEKKVFVDYDVVICIPTYDRYDKVMRMINQFYSQKTKYTFKIILLNDGSGDNRYDKIVNDFPELIYIKNDTSNGLEKHWQNYNQMWEHIKKIECHAILDMDDDFILCDKFLTKVLNVFFREKEKNNCILAIAPHTWSFDRVSSIYNFPKNSIDGIGLFDAKFITALNYQLNPIYFKNARIGNSAGVWGQITKILNNNNYFVYRTEYSLVWHDGNEDSKLHGEFRKNKAIYTQNFIDEDRTYD